jgi:tRNA pseudouridine13 synthase
MKLKQKPEDFIVEEETSLSFSSDKQAHRVYLMEKQGVDTFEALRMISQKYGIPGREIGYAGLKDKHALTRQYISIPSCYNINNLNTKLIRLEPVGYHDKKIKIGDLKGNKFQLTIRDLKEEYIKYLDEIKNLITKYGVPNYFDSQRFGSVINNEFIIKHVIKKNYEKAVKIYLTSYLKSEPKRIKDEKRMILLKWSNLDDITIKTSDLSRVIDEYKKNRSWLDAYRKIPKHLREIYVNAYQSFLWNECLKQLLKKYVDKNHVYNVEYSVGSLIFFTELKKTEIDDIPRYFPTLSPDVKVPETEQDIVEYVLHRENIKLQELDIKKETGNFFKARQRQTIIKPDYITISNPESDELNSKESRRRYKITVKFKLPQGSYATLITKRLFGH